MNFWLQQRCGYSLIILVTMALMMTMIMDFRNIDVEYDDDGFSQYQC